ncbi:hypothetical protein [Weissella confusa]|uniref:hypothetical protein n=1 Tax=Weissella confusa TaxID=1583 RepID=UPI0018F1FE7C|nr:hypothetical protein [Weissella confusa]MBJ7617175.1 hypothetical protein [Weissella confusa]MBJ7623597.1 hypothetical protein [Weissella confusa]MBJ7650564.1 hypothetical protein [Weissella confusa]MBJ7657808.1 hypothetical protein [Weissella confusa]MBJ7664649.1 hypothetical protein [Weissella confusa]
MKFDINHVVDNILTENEDPYVGYQMSGQGTTESAEKFFNRELMTEIRPLVDELNDDLDGTGVFELHTVQVSYNGDELELRFKVPVDLTETASYFNDLDDGEERIASITTTSAIQLAPRTHDEQMLYTVVEHRLQSRKRRVVMVGVNLSDMAEFLMTIPMNLAKSYDDALVRGQIGRR